jgi:hypothetical protein
LFERWQRREQDAALAVGVARICTLLFPEIDIPVVTVIWQYTGLSTPEMEQRVTTASGARSLRQVGGPMRRN